MAHSEWDFYLVHFLARLESAINSLWFIERDIVTMWWNEVHVHLFNLQKAHTIVSKVAIGPTVAKFLDEGQADEFWYTFRTVSAEKSKQKFNYLCLDFKRQLLLLRRL